MNRLVFFAAILFFSVNGFAQNESKVKSLQDALAKSNEAILGKKSNDPKTWMDRGRVFRDIYGLNTSLIRFGMSSMESRIFFKNPKQVLTKENNVETHEYGQIDLTFTDGKLSSWVEKVQITDDPYRQSLDAYKKATSLDVNGKNKKRLEEAYNSMGSDLEKKMFNDYANKEFKAAYEDALLKTEVSQMLGIQDTANYYYAGFFAFVYSLDNNNQLMKEAAANLDKSVSVGFDRSSLAKDDMGDIYVKLYDANIAMGDSAKAFTYATKGFGIYPTNTELINRIIEYYDVRKQSQEAMAFVGTAKEKNPGNIEFTYVEAFLYDRMGEKDKAIASYNTVIQAKPDFYNAYYNKAVIYVNSATEILEKGATERDIKKYDEMKKTADDEYLLAIPALEKALELRPNERDVIDTLKQLYFRFRNTDPTYMAKYEEMNKKLVE